MLVCRGQFWLKQKLFVRFSTLSKLSQDQCLHVGQRQLSIQHYVAMVSGAISKAMHIHCSSQAGISYRPVVPSLEEDIAVVVSLKIGTSTRLPQ